MYLDLCSLLLLFFFYLLKCLMNMSFVLLLQGAFGSIPTLPYQSAYLSVLRRVEREHGALPSFFGASVSHLSGSSSQIEQHRLSVDDYDDISHDISSRLSKRREFFDIVFFPLFQGREMGITMNVAK